MYNIPHFKDQDGEQIMGFMKAHSFAVLIGCINNVPVATQVPFLFEERDNKLFLRGHIMRNTEHHRAMMENTSVLCLFTGAHTYVSASLYANQQTASTWNYMSVHVSGTLTFLDSEALIKILEQTTDHYENSSTSPSAFRHLPADYVQKLAAAIVGFEVEVKKIDHVFKLSQNKKEAEFTNIVDHLSAEGGAANMIAEEMEKRKGSLFPSS